MRERERERERERLRERLRERETHTHTHTTHNNNKEQNKATVNYKAVESSLQINAHASNKKTKDCLFISITLSPQPYM